MFYYDYERETENGMLVADVRFDWRVFSLTVRLDFRSGVDICVELGPILAGFGWARF